MSHSRRALGRPSLHGANTDGRGRGAISDGNEILCLHEDTLGNNRAGADAPRGDRDVCEKRCLRMDMKTVARCARSSRPHQKECTKLRNGNEGRGRNERVRGEGRKEEEEKERALNERCSKLCVDNHTPLRNGMPSSTDDDMSSSLMPGNTLASRTFWACAVTRGA